MRPIFNTFIKGLVFALPLVITFGLIYWLFFQAENLLKIPLRWVLPEGAYITGMGLISAIALIFLLGVLVQAYLTKHLLRLLQELVARIPFVKTLYLTVRDFMNLFAADKQESMQGVVAITLDGDIRLMGFVTNNHVNVGSASDLVAVYFPMSYQIGGYTMLVPRGRLEVLDVPVKTAMQQVLTAHVTNHDHDKTNR